MLRGDSFPPYVERAARLVGVHSYGNWSIKIYSIEAGGSVDAATILRPALDRIPDLLPGTVSGGRASASAGLAGDAGPVHGEAFAILHVGACLQGLCSGHPV